MSHPVIDTNVIIRLLTGDDLVKQAAALRLFKEVEAGGMHVSAPVSVIADAVYVLSSRIIGYEMSRQEIAAKLRTLVELPNFHVRDRRDTLHALSLYGSTNLDFGDCFIIATMRADGSNRLYSWDRGFDRIPGIERVEP